MIDIISTFQKVPSNPLFQKFIKSQPFPPKMAKSMFEYVKSNELDDTVLFGCPFIVRIDGCGFHKFADKHNFIKPNDSRAIKLMNQAALAVCKKFSDITLAYGQSDEYSFLFHKDSDIYKRRRSKIVSVVVSVFTGHYMFNWNQYFSAPVQIAPWTNYEKHVASFKKTNIIPLLYPPSFDGRLVIYPTLDKVIDYFRWRQVDCHINCMYNTCFWALRLISKCSATTAEQKLSETLSIDKKQLFNKITDLDYHKDIPLIFQKGTLLYRRIILHKLKKFAPNYCSLVEEEFWINNPQIYTSSHCITKSLKKAIKRLKSKKLFGYSVSTEDDEFYVKFSFVDIQKLQISLVPKNVNFSVCYKWERSFPDTCSALCFMNSLSMCWNNSMNSFDLYLEHVESFINQPKIPFVIKSGNSQCLLFEFLREEEICDP